MATQKYSLNAGEKIVYKTSCVRHGFWGAYTHSLVITNQSVILEKYGMWNNFKGIERYYYEDISQAIQGEAFNGESQLEIYIDGNVEDFALQSGDDNELRLIIKAINDQMGADAEDYDYEYYQEVKDTDRLFELREKAREDNYHAGTDSSGFNIAGEAVKNIFMSGDISKKGIKKGVSKASKTMQKGVFGGMVDGLLDELGVRDIQDEFIEIGNEFREEFGLKTKMTHAEKKELEDLEEQRRRKELQSMKEAEYERIANNRKSAQHNEDTSVESNTSSSNTAKISLKEQMELLTQLKNLLDMGVLTQEEFDQKKKEIIG